MELLDIYDKYRQKTGRIHERGNAMNAGDYHLVVHVWIVNEKGQFLIQQEVIKRLELMYPQAEKWELETILSEKKNCYHYEKMGYVQNGEFQRISDKLTLASYEKEISIESISEI